MMIIPEVGQKKIMPEDIERLSLDIGENVATYWQTAF
jgi:hypothetical protein